ncbi:hypothetical protein GIB67_021474, partial [Kingdonia uniflora]
MERATATRGRCTAVKTGRGATSNTGRGAASNIGRGAASNIGSAPFQPPRPAPYVDIWQGIEFGQSKAQARVDGSMGVSFNDVAGIEEAVEELQETLVAKAIAGEAGIPFYQMVGSKFVEVLVGVGSARIRDLFKRAKVNKPSVIFIDEIDALATRYGLYYF